MRSFGNRSARGLAAIAAGAICFTGLTVLSTPAHADGAPSSDDIVGVGSDTLQYMLDFGADGDYQGNGGYNAGKLSRLVSFDATPDANARAGYLNGSTSSALKALNPTIVLRAGQSPVLRPNGSGAGINALLNDKGVTPLINFARSSSPLSSAQIASATAQGGVGNLHEIRLAKDDLNIAAAKTTNAVPLSAAQLFQIYQCNTGYTKWSDAGVGGTSTSTIIPVVPQTGSGTRNTFLTGIGFTVASNGAVTPPLGGCVKTAEENDPYALYVDSTGNPLANPYASSAVASPDAIEPISAGRLNLYANGYFRNPNVAYGAAPAAGDQAILAPAVKLIDSGTPTDSNPVYDVTRGLYLIFRDSDASATTKFNGGTKNWVNTLFYSPNSTPFFKGASGQALLASAGVTPAYADCGVNPASAAACGP